MLIQRTFRAVGSLASFDGAPVMPLYLVSRPSEPFLSVIVASLTLLYFLSFLFEFRESGGKLVPLIDELPHLGHENHISEVKSTVLMIVVEVNIALGGCFSHCPFLTFKTIIFKL